MKKIYLRVVCLILSAFMLLGCLSACSVNRRLLRMDEEKRAIEVSRLINEKMETVSSYYAEETLEMTYQESSVKRNTYRGFSEITATGIGKDDMRFYAETVVNVKTTVADELMSSSKVISKQGFQNGKMFISNDIQDANGNSLMENQLFSELSAQDYAQHRKTMDAAVEIAADSCTEKECEQQGDKGWEITFSGFTQDAIRRIAVEAGGIDSIIDSNLMLTDITMTVICNEAFLLESVEAVFETEFKPNAQPKTGAEASVITLQTTYGGINGTEPADEIDLEDYKKLEDLRILDLLDKSLNERKYAEGGSFRLTTYNQTREGREETVYDEVAEVSYSMKDGAFSYHMETDVVMTGAEATKMIVEYADGSKEMTINGRNSMESSNDAAEIQTIQSLMSCQYYSIFYVTDMVRNEDGTYLLTLDHNAISAGANTVTMTVSMQDGKLVEWDYQMTGRSGATYFTVQNSCEFTGD